MKRETAGQIAYIVLMTIYCLVILVLSSMAYSKFKDSTQTYLNMASNYQQPYLIDLTVGQTSCAGGYESLNSWVWGGTQAGCNCIPSTYLPQDQKVVLKACNSTQISNGCLTINEITGMTFNYVGPGTDSSKRANICVKRGEDSTAFYQLAANQLGRCSNLQKLCGNPSIPETVICVEQNAVCPIYQIVVSPSVISGYTAPEWSHIITANLDHVYYNQQGTSATTLPTSEVRFTQGSGVCFLDNNQKNLPTGATEYVLSNSQRTVCTQTDPSFIETSLSIVESTYYQANLSSGDYASLQAQSGNAAATSSYPFKSYRRPYINWKITERYQLKAFVECAGSVKKIKTAQLVCVIINVIVCIMIAILQVFQIFNLLGRDIPCIKGSGPQEQLRIVRIKKYLTYGSKFLQLPFLLWAYILSKEKKDTLRSAADASPSDLVYNLQMDDFASSIESNVYNKNLGCLIMYVITIAVDIGIFAYPWLADKCKKYKQGSDNNNQSKLDSSRNYATPKKHQGSLLNAPLNPQAPYQQIQLQHPFGNLPFQQQIPYLQGQLQAPIQQSQQVVNVVIQNK